jgi:hypothetical protein
MIRGLMMGVVSAAVLALSAAAFAQQGHPTSQEARAMLDKLVAAVKADKTKALDMFNKGETRPRRPTIRPNTDVLCFVEKKREDVSSEGLYPGLENATPDWVWTASLTKPVQRCQTLFRYLEILKIGLKFNRHINGF